LSVIEAPSGGVVAKVRDVRFLSLPRKKVGPSGDKRNSIGHLGDKFEFQQVLINLFLFRVTWFAKTFQLDRDWLRQFFSRIGKTWQYGCERHDGGEVGCEEIRSVHRWAGIHGSLKLEV
jgi:hypothetical protein